MKSIALCVLMGVLGALPGVVLFLAAQDSSFLGIALMGGLIGFALGATPLLYHTTILDALRRVAKGVAKTLIQYNVGEFLDLANIKTEGITAGEPEATNLPRDAPPAPVQAGKAISSAIIGGAIGAGVGAVAALITAMVCWDSFFADNDTVERGFLLFFCVMLAAFGLGVHGSVIGMLLVPGRHRLRIIGAVGFGVLLGLGLRVAVGLPKSEWGTTFCILVPVTICAAVGVFAPENL